MTTSKGNMLVGGALMGNRITNQTVVVDGENLSIVETKQEVNPNTLSKISSFYDKPGADMLHEVTESYLAGKNSQMSGVAYGFKKPEYDNAHSAATKQSGDVLYRFMDKNGRETKSMTNFEYIEIFLKSGQNEKILRQITKQ